MTYRGSNTRQVTPKKTIESEHAFSHGILRNFSPGHTGARDTCQVPARSSGQLRTVGKSENLGKQFENLGAWFFSIFFLSVFFTLNYLFKIEEIHKEKRERIEINLLWCWNSSFLLKWLKWKEFPSGIYLTKWVGRCWNSSFRLKWLKWEEFLSGIFT